MRWVDRSESSISIVIDTEVMGPGFEQPSAPISPPPGALSKSLAGSEGVPDGPLPILVGPRGDKLGEAPSEFASRVRHKVIWNYETQ